MVLQKTPKKVKTLRCPGIGRPEVGLLRVIILFMISAVGPILYFLFFLGRIIAFVIMHHHYGHASSSSDFLPSTSFFLFFFFLLFFSFILYHPFRLLRLELVRTYFYMHLQLPRVLPFYCLRFEFYFVQSFLIF